MRAGRQIQGDGRDAVRPAVHMHLAAGGIGGDEQTRRHLLQDERHGSQTAGLRHDVLPRRAVTGQRRLDAMGAPGPERPHRDGPFSHRSAIHRDRGAGRARLDAHVPEQLTQCDLTVAGISGTETEDDVAVGVTRSAQSCVMLVMRSHRSME